MNLERWGFGENRPLAERIQRAAFAITMVVAAVFGGGAILLSLVKIPDTETKAHESAVQVIGEVLAGDIGNKLQNLRQLSQSALVWTALTDSAGREAYLRPFLSAQDANAGGMALALFDYRGRFLLGELPPGAEEPALRALVAKAMADKRSRYVVLDGKGTTMFAVRPVVFPYTQEAIGVLAASIDVSGLFHKRAAALGDGLGLDLVHRERASDSTVTAASDRYHPVRHAIGIDPSIEGEGLSLELYATRNPWLYSVLSGIALAVLGAMALGFIVWRTAGAVAHRTTQRLDRLAEVCAAIARNEDVVIPSDPYSDEIGVLTTTLRQAIDAYRQINDHMAGIIATRTRQLAESEERLRGSIDAIDEAFVIFDADDRLLYCNQKYRETYSSIGDFIAPGRSFEEIIRAWAERGQIGLLDGDMETWVGQRLAEHRTGSVLIQQTEGGRWARIVERRTPAGDIVGFRVDITELVKAREAAEQANVAKSRFLATMSHEIRTPMNGILGMAQLLLQPGLGEAERDDYARTILNSGQTLLALLNDVLDLSKVEAGRVELESTVFDPQQVIHATAALFAEAARDKGLRIDVAWQGPPRQRYRGDPHRLQQMISNLVGNAVKFTATGNVRIEARETLREANTAMLEFAVADTGVGIPADKQSLLFRPFSQVDSSTTRRYGGTGLGLSIVRSLATIMGGDVGVSSEVGRGSRFWFRIRAGLVEAGEESREGARGPGNPLIETMPGQLSGRVLVVEDNATNRKVIEALLRRLGVEVALADDGLQGVAAVTGDDPPDLVLMDIHMPMLDGREATRRIRQWEREHARPHVPVVALTADAFEEDRKQCLAAGMDDFLAKPVSIHAVRASLGRWLPRRAEEAGAAASAPRELDAAVVASILAELMPMLAEHKFDAVGCFNELQRAVAGTAAAAEVAAAGAHLADFRFDLASAELARIAAARNWQVGAS